MWLLRAVGAAFALLTVLPIARSGTDPRALRGSIAFFPPVGAVLGAAAAGLAWLSRDALPPLAVAALVLALLAVASGGLHLDGLSDLFDAWGGGRGDRERSLAILRDPRLGAHGAAALVLVLLVKAALLAGLVERAAYLTIAAFPIAGRAAVVPITALFRPARQDGLAHALGARGAWGSLVFSLLSAAALVSYGGLALVGSLVAAVAVALALGALWNRRLGGVTGDVYGAALEIAETVFLLAASLR